MSSVLGRVKSVSGKSIEVKWSETIKEVYVAYAGWNYVGHASSVPNRYPKSG